MAPAEAFIISQPPLYFINMDPYQGSYSRILSTAEQKGTTSAV